MYKVTLKLSYYAPDGLQCNIGKELCRFCVKHKDGYSCSLYQEQLKNCSKAVEKCEKCAWHSVKFVDSKSQLQIYKDLRLQGYSEEIALQVAERGGL